MRARVKPRRLRHVQRLWVLKFQECIRSMYAKIFQIKLIQKLIAKNRQTQAEVEEQSVVTGYEFEVYETMCYGTMGGHILTEQSNRPRHYMELRFYNTVALHTHG